ncbi:class I SAM-dependent methyltransferase [Trichlorobacter lovleyi]|uniref:class I SAM-dependent methyltransferase n=1 Tax=Trichlorobacter lovleyi TaxID=313985 RepID=UPI00223FF161|nr:class I SAM-dependent methyltransferase [Trichlorobacter lovleyi]QOX77674.1 class I SAM-dependent methyltransferase [Trichlorobacter lovleyi]
MQIDAKKFDLIARNVFAPAYSLLAEQIMERTGIMSGLCLDLGSGGGYLGLALAWNSKLRVCLLDESEEMQAIAEQNIYDKRLDNRVVALCGDVHYLPLKNNSVDLVVSRGSVYFWDDLAQVLREIWRVLAPGGQVCIGGGFGSKALKDEIVAKMRQTEPDWQPRCGKFDDARFHDAVKLAGIPDAELLKDESGTWLIFKKPFEYLLERMADNYVTACDYK